MRHDRHMEPKARRDCRMSIDYVIAVTAWENVIQASNFCNDQSKQACGRISLAKPRGAVIVGGVFLSVTMTHLFFEISLQVH